jgi:hypothetical protein
VLPVFTPILAKLDVGLVLCIIVLWLPRIAGLLD